MPRRAARIDGNQQAIVEALRAAGATVKIVSSVGDGFGDLVVGAHGVNYLLEVKDGRKPPSKRLLTPDERRFHAEWRGQIDVVCSVTDALDVIGVRRAGGTG